MRNWISVQNVPEDFEVRLLSWAAQRPVACMLKSNRDLFASIDTYSNFEWCMAVDAMDQIQSVIPAFEAVKKFQEGKRDWLFGFLTYDLKNEIENLSSGNHDGVQMPSVFFFQPAYIFMREKNQIRFGTHHPQPDEQLSTLMENIMEVSKAEYHEADFEISQQVSRMDYIRNVEAIKNHIQRGDIYEMNYCVEFFASGNLLHPETYFEKLNEISPMPFSCFVKVGGQFLLSASPERFIAKRGSKIISQPIKGTARRGKIKDEDDQMAANLRNDAKERSENVMIVDLVRNDLSRTAKRSSVKVEELFGIYTFRQLHQMISTVVSEMREDVHWTDVIKCAFPMGSMTGAPKIRAMELIEEFENTRRGLYSGSVGYVTPEGDFDFNVVIRSIQYNEAKSYLSFMVGSAITINSDPEKEYDECLLKAGSMMKLLKKTVLEKNI